MSMKFVEVGLPTGDDRDKWAKFWKSCKQPWRTEPRISKERQDYLTERRKVEPDIEQGIYPFKDIKLNRADIEWLLSTHDDHKGPVNWYDESQREREGLDLRGADLRGEDLHGLPLAKIIAGPTFQQIIHKQHKATTIHLEEADLHNAHLEGAILNFAYLEGTLLSHAYLVKTDFSLAHLEGAILDFAHLEEADLSYAHLERTLLVAAHLEGAFFIFTLFAGASLHGVFFDKSTNLEGLRFNSNEHGTASLCDVLWGEVNVAVDDWSTISTLGDEDEAKDDKRAYGYEQAARAYRQLSVVLRNQGITEHASRFAYRAQLMQRKVSWYKRNYLSYFGSLFLDLLSGYGY